MLYKACPKCGGDVYTEADPLYGGGPDLICLQCGRHLRPHERAAIFSGRGAGEGSTIVDVGARHEPAA
jgi:predicted RNA-binding Zn-ribbon protein involved in translation (DUF1610 family)